MSGAPGGVLFDARHGARAGGAKPAMSRRGARWARHAYGLGLVLAAALALVQLGAARPGGIPLQPCTLGGAVEARCGTFRVPENRALSNGRTIKLRVAVRPHATAARAGPARLPHQRARGLGDRGRDRCTALSDANETRDIVLSTTGTPNRLPPLPRKPLAPHRHPLQLLRSTTTPIHDRPHEDSRLPPRYDQSTLRDLLGTPQYLLAHTRTLPRDPRRGPLRCPHLDLARTHPHRSCPCRRPPAAAFPLHDLE